MSKFLEFDGTGEIIVMNFEDICFMNISKSTQTSYEDYRLNDSEDKTIFLQKLSWNS